MSAKTPRRKQTHEEYTVAWICPLEIEEIAAVEMLDEEHERLSQPITDSNSYILGSIQGHNVAIAGLPTSGNCSAATVVAHMISTFPKIRFALLVGIGGGVPIQTDSGDIRLGHVVVSQPSGEHSGAIQYDHGKAQADVFERTGFLAPPPNILLNAARRLSVVRARSREDPLQAHISRIDTTIRGLERYKRPERSTDILFEAGYTHADRRLSCKQCACDEKRRISRSDADDWIVIHRGTIASGELVMRNGKQRDELAERYNVLCFEMEAAGALNDFPCLVIRGISDYSDSHKNDLWHGYAAATAAAYARELFSHLPIDEVLQCKVTADDVQEIKVSMQQLAERFIFTQLPEVTNAAFDSYISLSQDEDADYQCMRGTRIEILQQIEDWVVDSDWKPIFWLSGVPGTGKSTIARTVAHKFANQKALAASFFFKSNQGDRSHALKFFSTIATQFAQSIPEMRPYIKKALETDPRIMERDLEEQFDALLLIPLSKCQDLNQPFLLVIDALDECQGDLHTRIIIKTMSRMQQIPGARVFITSRPELPIRMGFKQISDIDYRTVMLQDIPEHVTKQDLSIYLRSKLGIIRRDYNISAEWPGEKTVSVLVDLANPLFILAATICRFIVEASWSPEEQLVYLLENQNMIHDDPERIYLPILRRALRGARLAELLKAFQIIVGVIVVSSEALSINTLAVLSELSASYISSRLEALQSVLRVPKDLFMPITLHHLSFANFLLDGDAKHEFRIDSRDIHGLLARRCLEILNNSPCLKEDICGMKKPGTLRTEVDKAIVMASIPPEVRYACCHWVTHLKAFEQDVSHVRKHLETLFTQHLLHWLEALSYLSKVHEAISMVSDLMDLLPNGTDLKDIVYDARRFIIANTYVADLAPLQLYSSALIMSPKNSIVRKNFNTPSWFKSLPTVPTDWTASFMTFEGHKKRLECLTFSYSRKLLASGAENEVKLWDIKTGKLQQTLDFTGSASGVAFSLDSRLLASMGPDLHLWDLDAGTIKTIIPDSELGSRKGRAQSIAFSADARLIAIAFGDCVKVWDLHLQQLVRDLSENAQIVHFSSFKQLLLLSSYEHDAPNCCIKLWDLDDSLLRWTLDGYNASFSPIDSGLMLSYGKSNMIRLSDVSSSRIHHSVLSGDAIANLSFFSHGKQVAVSGVEGFEIWNVIWDKLFLHATIKTGDLSMYSVPCDGNLIACSSDSGTSIHVYELSKDSEEPACVGNLARSQWAIAYSPNGRWTAQYPGHDEFSPEIWDKDMQNNFTLEGVRDSMSWPLLRFASNSKLLLMKTDSYVTAWTIDEGRFLQTFAPYRFKFSNHSCNVELLSTTRLVMTGYIEKDEAWAIELIDIETSRLLKRYVLPSKPDCTACSLTGSTIAYGVSDEQIRIWKGNSKRQRLIIPANGILRTMSFSEDLSVLRTNLGNIRIDGDSEEYVWKSPTSLDCQNNWLLSHGERILWLPPKHRGTPVWEGDRFASGGSGNYSVILEISSAELARKGLIPRTSE